MDTVRGEIKVQPLKEKWDKANINLHPSAVSTDNFLNAKMCKQYCILIILHKVRGMLYVCIQISTVQYDIWVVTVLLLIL